MTPRKQQLALAGLAIAVTVLAAGCAANRIKPWDRDLLAEKHMQFTPCPMMSAIDEHIYFSKEASTGGLDIAGGGCGCN